MAKNNSDYTRIRTNLNDYIPDNKYKTDTSITIFENLPNRLLTKDEFTHKEGIVGDLNPLNPALAQIVEPTEFLQDNQLQPIIHEKIGSVDYFMDFEDFLTRISRLNVDTTQYDNWGNSLQFNWAPPVDIDKLVNYQNYFWTGSDANPTPDYVLIKNLENWSFARNQMAKKTLFGLMPTFNITSINLIANSINISGNYLNQLIPSTTGQQYIILYDGLNNYDLFRITSATYNSSLNTTSIVLAKFYKQLTNGYISFCQTVIKISNFVGNNQITINGYYTSLFQDGYVFGGVFSNADSNNYHTIGLYETTSSTFSNNQTIITIANPNNLNLNNFTYLSLTPFLFALEGEYLYYSENTVLNNINVLNNNFQDEFISTVLWATDFLIAPESNAGETVFNTTTLTDHTVNFTILPVKLGDYVSITSGPNIGNFQIVSITPHNLYINTSARIFTGTNITYTIIRNYSKNSITSATNNSQEYWINSTADQLYTNSSGGCILVENFSLFDQITRGRETLNIDNSNLWAANNFWIHKNQISDFTNTNRAQAPIIEYSPYLELSNTSYAKKIWKYRKTAQSSVIDTTASPLFFEIYNIQLSGNTNYEFQFDTPSSIVLNQKYGNLSDELVNGYVINLSGFTTNNGTYIVDHSEYIQTLPTRRYITKIYLTSTVDNPLDLPVGATITPATTTLGDPWAGYGINWILDDIQISSSSYTPASNPMLEDLISFNQNQNGYEIYVGLYWQEFSPNTSATSPILLLDQSLHNIVLFDDYQEGDLRVYINGVRQYGNFVDIESNIINNYVGGISLLNITLYSNDSVRIELGEYGILDIGKGAVPVTTEIDVNPLASLVRFPDAVIPSDSSTGQTIPYKPYNLVDYRLIQQTKTELNQYPYFKLQDIYGNPQPFASNIFTYAEDQSYPINTILGTRVIYDATTKDYTFTQLLSNPETNEIYCYNDLSQITSPLQTIWKVGNNLEQYVPQKLSDGEWNLPNQLYYNVHHENRTNVSLTEFFTHFRSIIQQQTVPGILAINGNYGYLGDNINYGLGGTIKEHNDGYDLLLSSMFVNNINMLTLINFARDQYLYQLTFIQEEFSKNINTLLLQSYNNVAELTQNVIDFSINSFENNDKFDQWFGDSTTYTALTDVGIKNWIATIPYLNLGPKHQPYYINDNILGINEIVHHDGHRASYSLQQALQDYIFKGILANTTISVSQTIISDSVPFPVLINGNPLANGNFVIRYNTTTLVSSLYRYNSIGNWEYVDLTLLLINTILYIENQLYDNLDSTHTYDNFVYPFDFSVTQAAASYSSLEQLQFNQYTYNYGITTPYSNANNFNQNNPFTWNYFYTPIPQYPTTNTISYNTAGCWQALYEKVYGTPYPHLEPWKIQGYTDQPSWWNTEYADTTNTRVWTDKMWNNIFYGIIPIGFLAPDGEQGTGINYQITIIYSYVSVNVSSTPTTDGILPDGLLPPYWSSSNSSNPKVRSLYDPNEEQFIVLPNSDFQFGQLGFVEWGWTVAADRLYDESIIAFEIQPMRFLNQNFGNQFHIVNCLQIDQATKQVFSHKNTIWHGNFDQNGNIFVSNGLNQWYVHYNRYMGYDGASSQFNDLWVNWDNPLSYLFSSVINTLSFDISNDVIDISQADYQIAMKIEEGFEDSWIDALNPTLVAIPSIYSDLRNNGIGWTVQMNSVSPIARDMPYYQPQNYNFRMKSGNNAFRIYSYDISNVGISQPQGYQDINYNGSISLITPTGFSNSNFSYYATILINNTTTVELNIKGYQAQTFADFINQINLQLSTYASAEIYLGNLRITSNTLGVSSAISITDSGLFVTSSSNFVNFYSPQITQYSFNGYFEIAGNNILGFILGNTIQITNSTNYNGQYTIKSIVYDPVTLVTRIFVNETVAISNSTIDGILEPAESITLPPTWVNGTEVYLNTNGYLPNNFDDESPYYVIIIDDRTFQLSDTPYGALNNQPITPSADANGSVFVGLIATTFQALSGQVTNYPWRKHLTDSRYVLQLPQSTYISGIQSMVDFVTGYDEYHQSLGFVCLYGDGKNVDEQTGRINDWQLYLEKFITWMYSLSNLRQQNPEQYTITFNDVNNTITVADGNVGFSTGTPVNLIVGNTSSALPEIFNNPITQFVTYYIVRTYNSNTVFQLAASTLDAQKGRFISFTDNGTGTLYMQLANTQQTPTFELNPIKYYIWVNQPQGILSDVLKTTQTDILTNPRIYDVNGNSLTNKELIVLRQDLQDRISLTENTIEQVKQNKIKNLSYIAGMHLYFNSYENILFFNEYAADGHLIYDQFLGLNTPRFYLEFDRQNAYTLRPNVGGYFLSNGQLTQGIESLTDDIRYLYDAYKSLEQKPLIQQVRQSLGYEGTQDYLSEINLNPKTQFLLWKGMIHSKGTSFAMNAFSNQTIFENFDVDEFWAYKLATFGDSKERDYIEMLLYTSDTVRQELRLEFILPDDETTDPTFQGIKLTDPTRWWNQPDQLESMPGNIAFYFNSVIKKIANIYNPLLPNSSGEELITGPDGNFYYVAPKGMYFDKVIITYFDTSLAITKQLNEYIDYTIVNSTVIRFIQNSNISSNQLFTSTNRPDYLSLSISFLTYDFDAQNPARLIDKQVGAVITNAPFWNPALQQYYTNVEYVLDIQTNVDPAIYTNDAQTIINQANESIWAENQIGTVWFDNSLEGYIPYYDPRIYTSINDRIFLWGNTADWNEISLYQWTASPVPPDEWAGYMAVQNNNAASSSNMLSGTPLQFLYKNINFIPVISPSPTPTSSPIPSNTPTPSLTPTTGTSVTPTQTIPLSVSMTPSLTPSMRNTTPVWSRVIPKQYTITACLVFSNSNPFNTLVNIYINGKLDAGFSNGFDMSIYDLYHYVNGTIVGQQLYPNPQDYITVIEIIPTFTDTDIEITSGQYKYDTPYTQIGGFDTLSNQSTPIYYYWMKNKTNSIAIQDGYTTLVETTQQLQNIPTPYIILDHLISDQAGYGLVYGDIFDEDNPLLPYRYTRLIGKGLGGTVSEDDRFVLRYTRDFTLRDRMVTSQTSPYSPLYLKNVHEEWVLIRAKQLHIIDAYLWNKLTAALIGYGLTSVTQAPNTAIPPVAVIDYTDNIENLQIDYDNPIPALNRIVYDNLYDAQTQYGLEDDQIFVNPTLGLATIIGVLNDPTQNFGNIDITQFLATNSFDTPENIFTSMSNIYNNFAISNINYIYFQTLMDAMSTKYESKDFLKTSWVAIDIGQNVGTPYNEILVQQPLQTGGICGVEMEITQTPIPTPTPTGTPLPTQTQTPSVTPTNTQTPSVTKTQPAPSLSNTPTQTQTQTVTPTLTPTLTQTPSITVSFTQSITPTMQPTPTNTLTTTPSNTPTCTSTRTATATPTPTTTGTPTPTPSNTATQTPTHTATPSNTPSNTGTPRNTPTNTASSSVTPTVTPTQSSGAYSSWNSYTSGPNILLSNSNLTMTNTNTTTEMVIATIPKSTGKFYAEGYINSINNTGGTPFFGLAQNGSNVNAQFGSDGLSFGFGTSSSIQPFNVLVYHDTTFDTYPSSNYTGAGGYVKIAIDFDSGNVWFGSVTNNLWLGGGDPVAETYPTYTFTPNTGLFLAATAISQFASPTQQQFTLNTGQNAYQGTIPTGYSSWN